MPDRDLSKIFAIDLISEHFANCGEALFDLTAEQFLAKENIQLNIKSGKYKYESIYCPICNGGEFVIIAERDRYNLPTKTSSCTSCGLILSNPRLSEDSLDDFYKNYYRQLYSNQRYATEHRFRNSYRKGEKISNIVRPYISNSDNSNLLVIDIGCGDGGVLQYFSDQGYKCIGFEVDEEFGSKISGLRSFPIYPTKFDASTMSDTPRLIICNRVLEHIPDIREFLTIICNKMDKDSIIYTSVPSVVSFTKTSSRLKMDFLFYLHPAHIYHFSITSLENLMLECGLSLVTGDENGAIWKKHLKRTKTITRVYPRELYNLRISQRFTTLYVVRNNLMRVLVGGFNKALRILFKIRA